MNNEVKHIVLQDTNFALSALSLLDIDKPVFADTETEVLYAKIRLLQVYQPHLEIVYIVDFDYCDLDIIKEAIKPYHTVWAGAYYDFGTLNMTTAKYDDIQLLTRTAYPNLPAYDLASISKFLLDRDIYSGIDKKAMQKEGFKLGSTLSEIQLTYSALDVYALSLLWENEKIQAVREKLFYKVDMLSLGYSVQFQQNGALVDTAKVRIELDKLPNKLKAEEEILKGVNSKSAPQVKKAFENLLGHSVASTDKTFLIDIITKYNGTEIGEFATAVFDNRRTRLRETNLKKMNRYKLITRYNPYGTVTGRFSSTGEGFDNGINFQNITRDLQYLVAQDTDDTVVIHADYSTAELRAACSIMGDTKMREFLLNKVDLHKVSATLVKSSLTVEEVNKEYRQKGKAVSFGFVFGMSAERFMEYAYTDYGVIFTYEECVAIKKAYQTMYPDITKYHKYWWTNYKTEYVSSPMGRLAKPKLGTDAINFSTQSSIGETIKLAIHYMVKEDKEVLNYLYSQVHDAVYLRVPRALADKYAYLLVKCMLEAWTEILKLPMFKFKDIPMGVEFEIGNDSKSVEVFNIEELNKWKELNGTDSTIKSK